MSAPESQRSILQARLHRYSRAAGDMTLQQLLLTQAQRDILAWFEGYAWTFDPRQSQPHQPFTLYPYQRDFVLALYNAISPKNGIGHDLLIEKSRDMGISWLVLLVYQYCWLFEPGSNFHLGSRKADAVDHKGDISTLIEKFRYNLYRLPPWMRPAGFNRNTHDNLLKLINPANGNIVTGESSNENFARGGRYKSVLFDEFAFWPTAGEAFASAGQSTPSRVIVSTPYGKNNKFAELRFHTGIPVQTIHWRLHPHKDTAWYNAQTARMTPDEIARELDINYNLSVKDRVFPQFGTQHVKTLQPIAGKKIIRSWDFGFHCPACVLVQLDSEDRLLVLREIVGERVQLKDFAQEVKTLCASEFGDFQFEDVCDPAGAQKSDKSLLTSIEILNSLGVYPYYHRTLIQDGIELIRLKLSQVVGGASLAEAGTSPALLVDRSCQSLIEAFEGGYRYPGNGQESPLQEHPYEDVMDCLRYAVQYKCGVKSPAHYQKGAQPRRGSGKKLPDPYTGY